MSLAAKCNHLLQGDVTDELTTELLGKQGYLMTVTIRRKCCNFENGDGGGPERNWAARSQAARSNSWSMN